MSYTLNITWTAASPAPANGYRVKYWPASDPSNITTVVPNVSGTSYQITGLLGTSYSGTVESDCGGGSYSSAQNFSASVSGGNSTISISNFGGSGATIDDISPAWFIIDTGSLPLQNLATATGTHSGYTGNFGVTVSGVIGGCLLLNVNSTLVDTIAVSASGIYTFSNVSIPPNATVSITLDQGACQ